MRNFIGRHILQPIADTMIEMLGDAATITGSKSNLVAFIYWNALVFEFICEYYFNYELN